MGSVFSIFNLLDGNAGELHFLVVHKLGKLHKPLIVVVFLDVIHSLLNSLSDFERLIHLLDGQLVLNILHRVILHLLNLGKFDRDRSRHLLHHVVERLLHPHELVSTHHAWWEVLRLSILVTLGSSIGSKHHLHVDVGIHIHSLPWEAHLARHHHSTWEVANVAHVHVAHWIRHSLRLRHVHFVWTSNIAVGIFILSELCLSMCVRALVLISAISMELKMSAHDSLVVRSIT